MLHRLLQLLFVLGFFIIHSFGSDALLNLDDSEKLWCYSCKGKNCETPINDHENTIICNKRTQLCWAGYVNNQRYRTCASLHCTPTDISLNSQIRIETCCRSNLCNSDLLPARISRKLQFKKSSSMPLAQAATFTTAVTASSSYSEKETMVNDILSIDNKITSALNFNVSDPKSYGINWERVPYSKNFSNRKITISSILLILLPAFLFL